MAMVDIQYSTVLAVLYASYVPAQIPSNMVIKIVIGLRMPQLMGPLSDIKSHIQVRDEGYTPSDLMNHIHTDHHTTSQFV